MTARSPEQLYKEWTDGTLRFGEAINEAAQWGREQMIPMGHRMAWTTASGTYPIEEYIAKLETENSELKNARGLNELAAAAAKVRELDDACAKWRKLWQQEQQRVEGAEAALVFAQKKLKQLEEENRELNESVSDVQDEIAEDRARDGFAEGFERGWKAAKSSDAK